MKNVIEYRCTRAGHVSYLRLTTQRPEPDRWQDSACGFCLRDGVDDSLMKRVEKATGENA